MDPYTSTHSHTPFSGTSGTAPRSGGWKVALSATAVGALLFTTAVASAREVATDKLEYQPGETVTVTGRGWQPQEPVTLVFGSTSGTKSPMAVSASAGNDGTFKDRTFIMQETDRGQMLTVVARGYADHEAMVAFKADVAPGALRCRSLTPWNPTQYGIRPGETVTCTIEGATDLSAAQRAGAEAVEVLIRNSGQGSQMATVTSVSGTTITFTWKAPLSGCGNATVSYGPIKVCDAKSGKCATFPAAGNEANARLIGGDGQMAAAFQYLDQDRQGVCCASPPQLMVEKLPKNGGFTEGSQVSYDIVVRNPGPAGSATARDVRLRDELPGSGGLVWQSATTTQGSCVSPIKDNILNCDLDNIPPQSSVTVTVRSTEFTPAEACQSQPNRSAVATADGGVTAQDFGHLTCTRPITAACVSINASKGVPIAPVTMTATGGAGGAYTFLATGLPAGLTMSPSGMIFGTPNVSGTFGYTVTITDSAGGQGNIDCLVTVNSHPCIISGVTISDTSWNKFAIPAGTSPVVWVHAHIGTPKGIPAFRRTSVLFTRGTLSLDGMTYLLPDGVMIFDPAAPAAITTSYKGGRWETLVNPNSLSNQIFITGAAIPVTPAVAAGAKATWSFTVQSEAEGLSFPWQWSAAVYTNWPADWNQADIEPYSGSYHAGAPMNPVVQKTLIQGPRGGGGSNFTGSWSATGNGTCGQVPSGGSVIILPPPQ